MPDIKGAVTHKLGPLPVWGWVVAGAGAVFLVSRFKGGSSGGGAGPGNAIQIPTLVPGTASDTGGTGAVGSPSQNAMGGMDTQPGGAAPWWSKPPAWWGAVSPSSLAPALSTPSGTNGGGSAQPGQPPPAYSQPAPIIASGGIPIFQPGQSTPSGTLTNGGYVPFKLQPGGGGTVSYASAPSSGGAGGNAMER